MGLTARIAAAVAVMAVAGCGLGQSRANPLNWFGGERVERIAAVRTEPGRPVVDQIVSLAAAPTTGGVIVSTVGLPPTQGFWEADLLRVPTGDPSLLLLEFAILPPIGPEPVGTQPSREVLAGRFFSTKEMAGIRTIAVQGRDNRRSVSR